MTTAYPLQWPHGRPVTAWPKRAPFKATGFDTQRKKLMRELNLLGATDIVLSTNLQLRQDGAPYANRSQPQIKGVAIYFAIKKRPLCFACDRWDRIEDNLRALTLTIEALRGLERWGGGSMVEQAFSGFTALPAPSSSAARPWWKVLGVSEFELRGSIEFKYRELVKTMHPDAGGERAAWDELQTAIEQARAAR